MSKITYIKPKEHDKSNATTGSVEVHAELIGNDIDALAEIEQNTHEDDYDEYNEYGY